MAQYILGLLSGVLVAGFGAWLTIWLEGHREKERDKNIFEAFKEEVISNIEMLSANSVELEQELNVIANEQHMLTALSPYYFPTWDILKTHLPKELSAKETFRQLALTMHLSLLINSEITSREQFKINSGAMTNFSTTLKKRDELLLLRHVKLLTRLLELKDLLGLEIKFSSPSSRLMDAAKEFNKSHKKVSAIL